MIINMDGSYLFTVDLTELWRNLVFHFTVQESDFSYSKHFAILSFSLDY